MGLREPPEALGSHCHQSPSARDRHGFKSGPAGSQGYSDGTASLRDASPSLRRVALEPSVPIPLGLLALHGGADQGQAPVWGAAMSQRIKTQPLTITVTKTSDGRDDYVQIMSADQFSVNIVLISSKITVRDAR